MTQVLITGASGAIGTALRDRLGGQKLILTDVVPLPRAVRPNERFVRATSDPLRVSEAAEGCDLVVHLGWVREPRQDFGVLQANIAMTHCVLEGARRAGVGRFLFASSNHAVGYVPVVKLRGTGLEAGRLSPRPDDFYGVAKASCEALCAFYADEYRMAILSARLLSFRDRPTTLRELSTWLSPDDTARLTRAALDMNQPGHRICWGVSRNARRWASLDAGLSFGFDPQDDAEQYAEEILASSSDGDLDTVRTVGGRIAPASTTLLLDGV